MGYIMECLPEGEALCKNTEKYSFEEKIEKIKKIEEVMKKLHRKKIYICDLNLDNIFSDKNGNIRLIDCDGFVVKKNVVNDEVSLKYKNSVNARTMTESEPQLNNSTVQALASQGI